MRSIWELDRAASVLTLIYESSGPTELKRPDNMVLTPAGDLVLCEDSDIYPERLHGLTLDGRNLRVRPLEDERHGVRRGVLRPGGQDLVREPDGQPAVRGTEPGFRA